MKLSIAVVFGLLLWAVIKVFLFFGLIGLIGSAASGVTSSKSTAKSGSVYELELRGAVVEYQDEKDRSQIAAVFIIAFANPYLIS